MFTVQNLLFDFTEYDIDFHVLCKILYQRLCGCAPNVNIFNLFLIFNLLFHKQTVEHILFLIWDGNN